MKLQQQIAKQLRDVYFQSNWIATNLKEQLQDVYVKEATTKIQSYNTLLALVYHLNYYVIAVSGVLQGKPLVAKDKYSFDHPAIESEEDWQALKDQTWTEVEKLAQMVENLSENKLFEDFVDPKYGNYYRNLTGIIEHTYYHLGQIALLKKLLRDKWNNQSMR